MPETTQEIEARVKRDTIVDGRLEGHDRRLALINGQLERGAKATEIVAERVETLAGGVEKLRADINTARAIDQALRETAMAREKKQIGHREFWIGIALVSVAFLSLAATIIMHAL